MFGQQTNHLLLSTISSASFFWIVLTIFRIKNLTHNCLLQGSADSHHLTFKKGVFLSRNSVHHRSLECPLSLTWKTFTLSSFITVSISFLVQRKNAALSDVPKPIALFPGTHTLQALIAANMDCVQQLPIPSRFLCNQAPPHVTYVTH